MRPRCKRLAGAAALALTLALRPAQPAQAGGVPTIDAAAVGHLITSLQNQSEMIGLDVKQLENLVRTLKTVQQALAVAEDQYDALTGAREAIAELMAGDLSRFQLAMTLDDLNDAIGTTGEVGARVAEIDALFGFKTGAELYGSPQAEEGGAVEPSAREVVHDLGTAAVKTELVVAERTFAAAAEAMARYEAYREALGTRTPDLKASVDLNTRVQIENGQNLARILQMLAAQGQAAAVADGLAIRRQGRNAQMLR